MEPTAIGADPTVVFGISQFIIRQSILPHKVQCFHLPSHMVSVHVYTAYVSEPVQTLLTQLHIATLPSLTTGMHDISVLIFCWMRSF